MEAPVLEVILDSGAAHPADPAVDDDQLPVVDVAELGEVPAGRAAQRRRLSRSPQLGRAHDANLDAAGREALVELAARAIGVRPLAVDDEPHRDTLLPLREQRFREPLADVARPKAEL